MESGLLQQAVFLGFVVTTRRERSSRQDEGIIPKRDLINHKRELLRVFLARPESEPTTDLGKRLRLLRKNIGEDDLKIFSETLGVSKTALYNYEKGTREPPSRVLSAYSKKFGVNLNWILTGEGEMFADAVKLPGSSNLRTIDQTVFSQVGLLVIKVYKDESVKFPADVLLHEQASAYNALIKRAENPSDTEELLSLVPWLEARLRRSLKTVEPLKQTEKR